MMTDCPRYESCNAPICPLDPDWRLRTHIDGERVCFWLTEHAKTGAEARLRAVLTEAQAERVLGQAPAILARWGRIAHAHRAAAKSGSRIEANERLRRPADVRV